MHKLAVIIATKDRPESLERLLVSLQGQTRQVDQIIVVDGSMNKQQETAGVCGRYPVGYERCFPLSAARQRNQGLRIVRAEITHIGYFDDDAVLQRCAIEHMMVYLKSAASNLAGAGFNMINHPKCLCRSIKVLPVMQWFGFYSRTGGQVLLSGFQTMIGCVSESTVVDWLPSGAVVWKRSVLDEFQFDEWFKGYSYLEDLDFSYRVRKKYKLAIVAEAGYFHFPVAEGRISRYQFGKKEVLHRVYFVRKYAELSLLRCYGALICRLGISLLEVLRNRQLCSLQRVGGNVVGFVESGVLGKFSNKKERKAESWRPDALRIHNAPHQPEYV